MIGTCSASVGELQASPAGDAFGGRRSAKLRALMCRQRIYQPPTAKDPPDAMRFLALRASRWRRRKHQTQPAAAAESSSPPTTACRNSEVEPDRKDCAAAWVQVRLTCSSPPVRDRQCRWCTEANRYLKTASVVIARLKVRLPGQCCWSALHCRRRCPLRGLLCLQARGWPSQIDWILCSAATGALTSFHSAKQRCQSCPLRSLA